MKMRKHTLELSSMKNGQHGRVVAIIGGRRMAARLEALGVRQGVDITKKSALMAGGPVIIAVGNTEIAVGHEMASRIIVEVEEDEHTFNRES